MDIDEVFENQGSDADSMHDQEPDHFLLRLAHASLLFSLEAELRAFVRACNDAQPAPVRRLGFTPAWLQRSPAWATFLKVCHRLEAAFSAQHRSSISWPRLRSPA
jgi:hypothetical protein